MADHVDAEQTLIDWLKAVLGYVNVTDELPTNLVDLCRTNPVIVVERFGGNDDTPTIDVARVDVDVYANSRAGAKLHAERIRTAFRTRLAGSRTATAAMGRVSTISAPTAAPYDSQASVRRFTAAYQIVLHTYTGVS